MARSDTDSCRITRPGPTNLAPLDRVEAMASTAPPASSIALQAWPDRDRSGSELSTSYLGGCLIPLLDVHREQSLIEVLDALLVKGVALQWPCRVRHCRVERLRRHALGPAIVNPKRLRCGARWTPTAALAHTLELPIGRLLCVDWVSPHGPCDNSLMFIFDGGVLVGLCQVGARRRS